MNEPENLPLKILVVIPPTSLQPLMKMTSSLILAASAQVQRDLPVVLVVLQARLYVRILKNQNKRDIGKYCNKKYEFKFKRAYTSIGPKWQNSKGLQ